MSMNGFGAPIADEALWREMEKEQIRMEIIAGKIAYRRQLEEEVMRELAMERAFGIPMERYSTAPYPFMVDGMNRINGEEIKPSSSSLQINKDKVIMLPKPNLDLHSPKRKAETLAVSDTMPSAICLRKKAKEEWRCAVCQLSVTSESQLNDHQRGKQHKAKEAALKTQMIGEGNKAGMSSKETATATEKAGEVNSLATREEVRKELALGTPMQKCLAAPTSFQEPVTAPTSFQEPVTKRSVPITNSLLVDDSMESDAHPPKVVAPVEIEQSSEIDKGKVIMLAKPDADICNAKQKAEAPAVYVTKPSELVTKKKLEEWSCSLCRISTTSERGLMEHMYGKKHKAKEAALRTQKIDKNTEASLLSKENEKGVKTTETIHTPNSGYTKADMQMPPPFVTLGDINGTVVDNDIMESSKNEEQLVEKDQTTAGLKNQNQNETTIEEVGELSALRKRNEEKEELAMESASGIQCLAAPFPFQEPAAKLSNPIMNSIIVDDIISASQLQLPQIVTPVEIKPSPQIDNGKAIMLAKCDTDLYDAKQNAVAPAVDGTRSSESDLAMKSASGIRCLAAPFPSQEPVAKLSNPIMNSIMVDDIIGASQLQLPQIVTPMEIKPSPQIDNDKAILAKADTDLLDAKQKAMAPAVDGTRSSKSDLKEKPKEEWSCAICRVSTTSEKNLNEHLHSKKHKAKQTALDIQEAGKSIKASLSLKESEKGVKAADAEVFFVAPPTLDPKILEQFPQPSLVKS